jgi:hypothetical protein
MLIPMQKLSWKEKYAGVLVLLIGVIYLLMQLASLLSDTSQSYGVNEGSLVINKNALFSDIKAYIVIIMGLVAGPMLLKNKTIGWVLGLPVLLLFAVLLLSLGIQQAITVQPGSSLAIPGIALLLLVMAIVFLFAKPAREKYRVSKYTVLLTLFLFTAIGGLYFFLQ